jgi:DNA-binding GntR family transcriptional regulator
MLDNPPAVKQSAYMDFKEATDGLFDRISHEELAKALGVSVALIRQARLPQAAKARREPPKGWEGAVIRLAETRVWHYRKLIDQVRKGGGSK